ncbi:uncharacterized protein LOC127836499 isoform X2 [Dreissena polymorpha]|uniref:uncharacterized protein LOC127836499 isoform X2 n=1 Tax=Dreissena polymorpha TaxID=45954 RepID=UPI002263D454|nr:uncharacterized protein LOC127836499 isoform X2 [Dreissena polymorpha]
MGFVKLMAQLVIVFFLLGILKASEPMCLSRFDYDEKMLLKMLKLEDALEKIEKSRKDNAIAFTASGPVDFPFRFDNVLTNIGGRYYQSSGHFICNVPGLYYFTFHLVKKRASPAVDLCQ